MSFIPSNLYVVRVQRCGTVCYTYNYTHFVDYLFLFDLRIIIITASRPQRIVTYVNIILWPCRHVHYIMSISVYCRPTVLSLGE